MYRVVPSGFLASDRKTLWKQRLEALFGFSVTCIKNEARFMWSVPTGDNGTYENTTTTHTVTDIQAAPDTEMNHLLQFAGVALWSQNKIRSAFNFPNKVGEKFEESGSMGGKK